MSNNFFFTLFSSIHRDSRHPGHPRTGRLTGIEIITTLYEVQLTSYEQFLELKQLKPASASVFLYNYGSVRDKMNNIIIDFEKNLLDDHYGVNALQTFLDEIKDIHLKELEALLKEVKQHLKRYIQSRKPMDANDPVLSKLAKKINTNLKKISIKLSAISSEHEQHSNLLGKRGKSVFDNANNQCLGIKDAYGTLYKSYGYQLENLIQAIRLLPAFLAEINKLKNYLPANETPAVAPCTIAIGGTIDIGECI